MKCPQCQLENPAVMNVCTSCGAELFPGVEKQRRASGNSPDSSSRIPPQQKAAIAEAEQASREMRRKRAFSGSAEITGSSPYITQPSIGRQRVGQIERQMSMALGLLFVIVIGVAAWVVTLNLPDDEKPYAGSPLAFLIEEALRKPNKKVNAETYIGYEIGSPMMYDAKAALGLREVETALVEAPAAAGKTDAVQPEQQPQVVEQVPRLQKEEPPRPEKIEAMPLSPTPPAQSAATPEPVQVANLKPVEKTEPPPPPEEPQASASRVPVVDRSIVSEKPRKRAKSGCMAEEGSKDCAHRHVVTFKRNWGPVLEERIYPSRDMSRRAQELWRREGKILEPDGRINDTYVLKPKSFSPIPGHPT
jgi:outer membrane biosynthesis protein TonB